MQTLRTDVEEAPDVVCTIEVSSGRERTDAPFKVVPGSGSSAPSIFKIVLPLAFTFLVFYVRYGGKNRLTSLYGTQCVL